MVKISVILPVYNCEHFIYKAINSVLNQTFEDFELIIVDDCSTDNTVGIIRKFNDKRIQLIVKEKNTGYTNSLNYAVSIAKGEYIARMDGDDICLPSRFEKQVAFLEANPNVILCGTNIEYFGAKLGFSNYPINSSAINISLCFGNPFCHPSVMGRTKVFLNNPYDVNAEPAEDIDLWSRLVLEGEVCNLKEVLLKYRVHSKQISSTKGKIQLHKQYLSKLRMFSSFEINEKFSSDDLQMILKHQLPKNYEDCKNVLLFFDYIIEKNFILNNYKHDLFTKEMNKYKIRLLKEYFSMSRILNIKALYFLLFKIPFTAMLKILNLSKKN